ncbi:MAG: RluA family pseudouridine synthase [Vicinamibacterales bacterium]|nr:RluA family pseudouridine synthase [Vicinamibacterales bacterium]
MTDSLWRLIALDRGDAGMRLDRVLLRHLRGERGLSRNRIQHWIEEGAVTINGRPAPRSAWRVSMSDEVRVRLAAPTVRVRPVAETLPLDILYEDDDLIAVNKPAGQVVHPSYKNASGTLMNALLARTPTPSLVHRLDKQTSGLVLVAKHRASLLAMQAAMEGRRVDKEYLAVVIGRPSPARGTIDLALDRDPWDRRRVTVRDRGGVPSVTRYVRLASRGPASPADATLSLVRCRLITGRMHQIRVHLSAKGWPLVGDPTYGASRAPSFDDERLSALVRGFGRQALHAWRIALAHPGTGRRLEIEAPIPPDLEGLLEAAGLAQGLWRSGPATE